MTRVNVTLLVDASGSMAPQRDDTIKGIAQYIQDLRNDTANEYFLTLVTFNNYATTLYRNRPISEAHFTERDYNPNGGTALLDAIGSNLPPIKYNNQQLEETPRQVKDLTTGEVFSARRVIPGEKNIVVIVTDGEENASKRYKLHDIKPMIEDRKYREDWAMIFMGADESLWSEASDFGYGRHQFVDTSWYHTPTIYRGLSSASQGFASGTILSTNVASMADAYMSAEEPKKKKNKKVEWTN